MFKAQIGDLFASEAKVLVNTVNCVGVMGKGVALEFKKRFPRMARDYVDRCNRKQVRLGEPYLYEGESGIGIIISRPRGTGARLRGSPISNVGWITWQLISANGASQASPCHHSVAETAADS